MRHGTNKLIPFHHRGGFAIFGDSVPSWVCVGAGRM